MLRLPSFRFHAARTVAEAVDALGLAPPGEAAVIAGGTDLLPNMKRRQQTPRVLVSTRGIPELRTVVDGDGLSIGASVTLSELVERGLPPPLRGLWQACSQIATPHLRNMGTIGGNICLDTRCNYYDQGYEWRKAIDFCLKRDGQTCWVAPSSGVCLAVSSTDTAPALLSLGAMVTLAGVDGVRTIPLRDLYRQDGIHYLTRQPTEILTKISVPRLDGWASVYWKLRRRGSFDFPVLSVAAAVKLSGDGTVEAARIVLGAVASQPLEVAGVEAALLGHPLTDQQIDAAADLAARPARPMDNTDFTLHWRKRMTRSLVTYALRELRGDGMRAVRWRLARQLV